MDVADHATDRNKEAERLARLNGAHRRSGRSAYRCEECGDAIPEDRRQAEPGIEHCDSCTAALNHLAKRGPQWI